MSYESQPFAPAAPAPQQSGGAPSYQGAQPAASNPAASGGQPGVVFNPALGPTAAPVELPRPLGMQPATPHGQQVQEYNPYSPQQPHQQQPYNPYLPQQQQAPQPQQPQYNPYAQQPAPQQYQQQQQTPAYQFTPPQFPASQPQPQVPQQPQRQAPQQQQPQQQQSGALSEADIAAAFPDPTSRAIFGGMNAIAAGQSIDLMQAFGPAYETRDPRHVNEAYLAQFDQATAQTLRNQFGALLQAEQARDAQVVNTVHQMAGGQQQWESAVGVFNQAAPAEQKQVLVDLFNSGDPQKVAYATQQVLAYAQQSGRMIVRQPGNLPPGGPGAGASMMTREEFHSHLDMLAKAHQPGTPEYQRHYDQLIQQRQQAKSAGY